MSPSITSPLKRLRTRPTGVVSKNRIGCAKIASSIAPCSLREARTKKTPQVRPRSATSVAKAAVTSR